MVILVGFKGTRPGLMEDNGNEYGTVLMMGTSRESLPMCSAADAWDQTTGSKCQLKEALRLSWRVKKRQEKAV